jgi:signal transduction histidine kinase
LLRLKAARDELGSVNRNLKALVESRTRELLRKENQAVIGRLVQGLAHNIRGPMAVVQARAELTTSIFRDHFRTDPEAAEDLPGVLIRNQELILEAARKVEALVDNLLKKGRNEASMNTRQIDLNELIGRELEFLEADPHMFQKVDKRFLPAEGLPAITGVYADFSQVVYNLVINAAEAMDNSRRKELEIRTGFDEDSVFMVFADSGEGISPGIQDRIFDCFFSTKIHPGGQKGGSGLGLYTCSQLMKPYGASISVENNPEGGCRFTVTIPRSVSKPGRDA